ncbi:hypothetical protein [Rufibacter hautae]|uniref:Uncharacterized protein n=1 Tax=Rufibacter hautae TaxID=2595005 RepID=A0A5B6THJ8_9BACT|nr:hypothetical protein [Rufibacter hautae]KAA3438732.1 hypothetical protein FOA19_16070 [Rufibacter hautae]
MKLTDINNYLEEHSNRFKLANIAEENCKRLLEERTRDSQSEWNDYRFPNLVFRLIEQVLVFNHILRSTPQIRTRIGIYIKDPDKIHFMDLEQVGYYQLDSIEDGEIIDDWLVFEK